MLRSLARALRAVCPSGVAFPRRGVGPTVELAFCRCFIAARVLIIAEWTPTQIEDLAIGLYKKPADAMPPYTLQVAPQPYPLPFLFVNSLSWASR